MPEPINLVNIERYWFLTWTTYGSWLPGDERGFVGSDFDDRGILVEYNEFATPHAPPNPDLNGALERRLKSTEVLLTAAQASALLGQFQETTRFRNWLLIATGIMRTHVHALVGVSGDPDPEKILGDLKAYGTRCLNRMGTLRKDWWTRGGSKRKLPDERAVETVVQYIRNQANPLLIWTRSEGLIVPPGAEE